MPTLNPSVTVDVSTTSSTSQLNNINYLQPNAFKLTIDRKNFPNLEFFAQSVLHPDTSLTAAELPHLRVANVPMPGDTLRFGELSALIILDENMNSYIEMYNWITRIIQQDYKTPLSRTNTNPPTTADITVSILSSHNNVTRTIKYIDCVPTGLGNISFESTTTESFITYPANFRFSYFEVS